MVEYKFVSREDYTTATKTEPFKRVNTFAELWYNNEHVGYRAWYGKGPKVHTSYNFFLFPEFVPQLNKILEAVVLTTLELGSYNSLVTYKMFNALLKIDGITLKANPKANRIFSCTILKKEPK